MQDEENFLKLKELTNQICKKEELISEETKKYQKFFKKIYVPFLILDYETNKIIDFNKAFCKTLKYNKKEIAHKNFLDLIHTDEHKYFELEKFADILRIKNKANEFISFKIVSLILDEDFIFLALTKN